MNENTTPDFDLTLSRLVDGQLTGEPYRAFVAALDERPGGWRRCALAFLEDQALRRELGDMLDAPRVSPPPAAARRESRLHWLALAAAVLVAFSLGLFLRGAGQSDPTGSTGDNPLVATTPETDDTPATPEPSPPPVEAPLAADPAPQLADAADATATDSADLDPGLTVLVGEGDQQQSFRLPVSEVDQLDEDWFAQQQWAFDSQAQQNLAAQGYQGTSRQSFVPIDLGDGRQMILPVEEVLIQPVAYQ